jgi:hypothetical protein
VCEHERQPFDHSRSNRQVVTFQPLDQRPQLCADLYSVTV